MPGSLFRYVFWLILFIPSVLKAQTDNTTGFSNIRTKKLAILKDSVQIDSLSTVPGSLHLSGADLAQYSFYPEHSLIVWKHRPAQDSVVIIYRVLPISLHRTYAHKLARMADSNGVFMDYRKQDPDRTGNKNFVDYNPIEYSGSYGRSIALGNNQDVVLNSHFNLQVNGYLLDSIKLEAALTDNTIPFQPEGNTQRLQEFDQIYIHLSKRSHDLLLGDYTLEKPPGYFLNFSKRVQGVFYQDAFRVAPNTVNKIGLSGSIAKGQFARNIFNGLEGNQGPYKLTGNNREQYFIVLAGTEKVYVNNIRMERGENADYIINYNTGEVRFMPRMMISKDSRIQVEFEYQDRNYLNSLIYAYDELQVGKKLNIRFNAYSNQDAKNQSYLQNLSGEQKRFLTDIGDSIQNALYPVIVRDTFAANKVLYKLIDSTVNAVLYDSVFVYSTNPDSAIYNPSFSFVGTNRGDYIISNSNANGRVYQWVAPQMGVRQGDYAPVQLLVTPKKQQVYTLGTTWQIDSLKTLGIEIGGSNKDPNLFSDIDNNTHWGFAAKMNYLEKRYLGKRDSLGQRNWNLQSNLSYEYVQDKFQAIAPYRSPEFARDWNIPVSNSKPDEHLVYAGTRLANRKLGALGYNFSYFKRGIDYTGDRHIAEYNYAGKTLRGGVTGNVLQSTDTFQRAQFLRPSAFLEKDFPRLAHLSIGTKFAAEYNYLRDKSTDTLKNTAFAFDVSSGYIRTPDAQPVHFSLTYNLRRDLMPRSNLFQLQSHSHNAELKGGISKWKDHALNFTATFRKLEIDDSTFTNQKPEETLLGRLEYNGSLWKQALILNTLYEIGSGQEQRRSYTYVEVPAGQGVYTWNDYNNDGVQQSNEFEVALYPDQKKFIKVLTPTNEYVKVNYVNFNQGFTFEPGNLWEATELHGFRKFIARFSDQASVQINNRLLAEEGLNAYNPFIGTQEKTTIIATSNAINNSLYFNRNSAKWGIDYNLLHTSSKQLLTYGVEGTSSDQHLVKARWNITRSFTANLNGRSGFRTYRSALDDGRSYQVNFISGEPQLTWLYQSRIRITGGVKYEERTNLPQFGGEKAVISSANLDIRWSEPTNGTIQVRGTYSNIEYNGPTNTPVSFIMLDALQNGSNYLWYANWERRVGKGIEVSLEYEGRLPGGGTVIHTGRMSIRAVL